MLVNLVDPANLWGRVWPLSRLDGSRVRVPRLPHDWLVFRAGRPMLLAEGYGRELTPLAGCEPVDLPGVVAALQSLMERPISIRPVRRLEVAIWDGHPVRGQRRLRAIRRRRLHRRRRPARWDGYPGPRSAR